MRAADVAQLHAVRQLVRDEPRRQRREQHLAALAGGADPRAVMHREADVALVAEDRVAGVQAHAHAHAARRAATDGRECARCAAAAAATASPPLRKTIEAAVALGADEEAVERLDRVAQQPAMGAERLLVALAADVLEAGGSTLDVREEERQRAGRRLLST